MTRDEYSYVSNPLGYKVLSTVESSLHDHNDGALVLQISSIGCCEAVQTRTSGLVWRCASIACQWSEEQDFRLRRGQGSDGMGSAWTELIGDELVLGEDVKCFGLVVVIGICSLIMVWCRCYAMLPMSVKGRLT
jgi:hypothetical protein